MKLSYSVYGPTLDKSRGTVVFMHGWPDNSRLLYSSQVAHLANKNYRCVIINNLNALGPQEKDYYVKWGADFEEIVDMMHDIIGNKDICGTVPVSLFVHDWGSVYGFLYECKYPERVARMYVLDVGLYIRPTLKEALIIYAYQFTLITAFLIYNLLPFIGPWIGDALNQLVLYIFRYPAVLRGNHQSAAMNFSYLYAHLAIFKSMIFGVPPREKAKGILRLKNYQPHCPIFFGYAAKSPVRFFGDKWKNWLEKTEGCKFEAYPSHHWIMVKCAEEVNRDSEEFFNEARK